MPNRTRAEELRHVAGLQRRYPDRARATFDDYAEDIDTIRSAKEQIDAVDIDDMVDQLQTLHELLDPLADGGIFDRAVLDQIAEVYATLSDDIEPGLDASKLETLIEAYETLDGALDDYDAIAEQDRYEGKTDDLEGAWEEVTTAMESLADAADALEVESNETAVDTSDAPVDALTSND